MDVNTVVRAAHVLEIKKYIWPILYLTYEDITTKTRLDSVAKSFSYIWAAPSLTLELYIMAKGAPILSLTSEELALLKPFFQKFRKATEGLVDWKGRCDFHRLVTQPYSVVKNRDSQFSTLEVEKMLQGVPSLGRIKVWTGPKWYKLLAGTWTNNANEYNLEITKEQMKENTKKRSAYETANGPDMWRSRSATPSEGLILVHVR